MPPSATGGTQATITSQQHRTSTNTWLSACKPASCQTFAEECVTVQRIGLRYIWIDSLCIIQDSPADKVSEIPKMADYYQNAELNLSAAAEPLGGLWPDRDGAATKPFRINATLILSDGKSRQVVLNVVPVLRADKSHLDYRGWILQERIFPRRTLFFDAYWLAFECGRMSASESCPDGVELDASSNRLTVEKALGTQLERDCTLSIIGGIIRSISPASPVTDSGMLLNLRPTGRDCAKREIQPNKPAIRRQILILWYRILNEYSIRQLSFESDRLDAIAGLAERLSRLIHDEYIGGI